jgi:Tfp pilus assembly protein PilO
MMRFITPLILIAVSVALFVFYTDDIYQAAKEVKVQVSSYDNALNKSQELKKVRDQLLSRRNAFVVEDVQKLKKVLPDNVDNIRLIIDINNIAARRGLTLKNLQIGEISDSAGARSSLAVGSSGEPLGSVTLSFAVSASYENFLVFLADIEHSLRIVDVEKIAFSASSPTVNDYSFTIRTYWLR